MLIIKFRIYSGVETVKADLASNKVTVTGQFDAVKLQDKLAEKAKKKVDIISAPPKKDAAAEKPSEKKAEEKKPEEKKAEEKKPEENKPKEVLVQINYHLIFNQFIHLYIYFT